MLRGCWSKNTVSDSVELSGPSARNGRLAHSVFSFTLHNGKVRGGTLQQRGKHPRLTIMIKYLLKIQFKTT